MGVISQVTLLVAKAIPRIYKHEIREDVYVSRLLSSRKLRRVFDRAV